MAISDSGVIVIVIVCCGVAVCLAAGIGMHMRSRGGGEPTFTMYNEENMRPSSDQKKYMDWVRRDSWKMSISQATPMRQNSYASTSAATSQV